MTIQKVIDLLNEQEDKEAKVLIHNQDWNTNEDIIEISFDKNGNIILHS